MSIENAKSFYTRVTTDEAFRTQLEQIAAAEERRQTIQAAGYEFTPDEWKIAQEQILAASDSNEEELSDTELAVVNGGIDIRPIRPILPFPMYGKPIDWDRPFSKG